MGLDFVPMKLPTLGIFATCRQVYHEASSVFFSQNRFTISRPRCDTFDPRSHDSYGTFIAEGADWLITIGSQMPKLQRLVLDCRALCGSQTLIPDEGGACIELLPLLRVVWNRLWTGKVEFRCVGGRHFVRWCKFDKSGVRRGEKNYEWNNVETLTTVLDALQRDDLNIRRFERVISHVAVHRKGSKGVVLFHSNQATACSENQTHKYYSTHGTSNRASDYECVQHRLDFVLDKQGIRKVYEQPTLFNFTYRTRRQIFDYLLVSDEAIDINLNRGKDQTSGLLFLTRDMHIRETRRYYMLNNFNLHVRYKVEGSEVFGVDALDWWMSTRDFSGRGEKMAGLKGQNVRSICLNFDVPDGSALAPGQLKINTAALLRHGAHLGARGASVSIRVRIASGSARPNDLSNRATFSLYTVRFKALRVLRKLRDADLGLERDDDVEIIINGYGLPVGYTFPGLNEVHRFP